MTREEFIEDLMTRLENLSSELEYLQNVRISDFEEDEDEGLTKLMDELDELNDQINKTIYRSSEFFELQEKIVNKEGEIEDYVSIEVDESDLEDVLDKINEFGYESFDTQYNLYRKLENL